MLQKINIRWFTLISLNALAWGMLSFYGSLTAAPPKTPFSNSVEQRHEMIRELKEIKALLQQQNELLRTANMPTNARNQP